jgi:hypothetical protein
MFHSVGTTGFPTGGFDPAVLRSLTEAEAAVAAKVCS